MQRAMQVLKVCAAALLGSLAMLASDVANAAPQVADGEHGLEQAAEMGGHPMCGVNWLDLGYKSKNVCGGMLGSGLNAAGQPIPLTAQEPMSPPFLYLVGNFALVLVILGWKVRPIIRRAVEKRHLTFKQSLDEAKLLRQRAADKLAEYESRIRDAETEVDALIKGIRTDAEAERKRIIADAEAQAAALRRDADSRIAAEIERARYEIEREVVAKALAAAEAILRERATPGDKKALVDDFIASIDAGGKQPAQERI